MQIKTEDMVVNGGVSVGLQCGVVLGPGNRVTERILVRIEQNTRGVVVPCAPIRVQSKDVWPNDALDVKVRWQCWSRRLC